MTKSSIFDVHEICGPVRWRVYSHEAICVLVAKAVTLAFYEWHLFLEWWCFFWGFFLHVTPCKVIVDSRKNIQMTWQWLIKCAVAKFPCNLFFFLLGDVSEAHDGSILQGQKTGNLENFLLEIEIYLLNIQEIAVWLPEITHSNHTLHHLGLSL